MTYYSESLGGFIPESWKTDGTYTDETWPADAVLLTEGERSQFWRQPAPEGKTLGSVNGRPAWIDLPAPPAMTRERVEIERLRAYADPVNGSDRYFAEAVRLQAMGATQAEVDAASSFGTSRYQQIQSELPWPAE
ncbi:hypothetical protein ACBG90_19870 [Stutzerimonas kunmingensis]|uniref:hypothetical protein n=1 Tax=Stutzerimonas kunmingensis TaxID=1211807 RepID=UPI00352424D9